MTDCRTTLDCSRVRVVLAMTIIRSCPRRCSIYSHIKRILRRLKRKDTRNNSIFSLIKLERSALLSLASVPPPGSGTNIKPITNSPASAVSEETYFSTEENICSPMIGNDDDQELSNVQQVPNNHQIESSGPNVDAVPSDPNKLSSSCSILDQELAQDSSQTDVNPIIYGKFSDIQEEKLIAPFDFLDLPEGASLTFLAATDHLCSHFGERSSFLPEASILEPSRTDLTDYVRIILEYVCNVPSMQDVLPLSLTHGMDLVSRILLQNPELATVLRPLLLKTIQTLIVNVYEDVGSRLLSSLLVIPDFAGSIIRALNMGLQQVSKQLQETYKTELMTFPNPCATRADVFGESTHEKKLHLLQNMSPDRTLKSGSNLNPQSKTELSKRSLYIAEIFLVVLQTLHEDQLCLDEIRYDLECSLRILEQSTSYISDRYPQFVDHIFESIRLVHSLIG